MSKRLIKQNKSLLSIVIILLILFGSILYFGGKQIYEREAQWQHGHVVDELLVGKNIVEAFFSEFFQSLFFLRELSSTKGYVESDFDSISHREKAEENFFSLVKIRKHYCQISIIDSSGQEVLRIDNRRAGAAFIVPESQLQNEKHRGYFQEAMRMRSDQIYVSPIDSKLEGEKGGLPNVPMLRLATPLFDSKNGKKGVLVLDIYFSEALQHLPKGIFIQTEEENLISLKSDRTFDFKKSPYNFSGRSGMLGISDVESIHYDTLEFLPGKRLILATHHYHPLLKQALQRLVLASVILLALFLFLITIIVYINLSRFRELIKAQRAIIFSLAGLAESRDPETGHHLERTKQYAVGLAKQLRKNRKYRKIITNEFIEDLSDAAPLHDIGKVGIRDHILLKQSELTEEEYEEIKKHVHIGENLLQHALDKFTLKQSSLIMSRKICAYHHEKYNGKGYPEGMKGEKIPLEARIFALCDAYDVIRSKRPYKDGLSHEEAVRRIKSDRGEHFDPDIVDAFLKHAKVFLEISHSYLE